MIAFWIGVAAWSSFGVAVAIVQRRRGHNLVAWIALGVLLGPITLGLVSESRRHEVGEPRPIEAGWPGGGQLDVLVGIDGSAAAERALAAAVARFGPQLGTLTLATVIDYDTAGTTLDEGAEHDATQRLQALASSVSVVRPGTVLLTGRPSQALLDHARAEGFELIVVGRVGRGISERLLGSVTRELVEQATVPILVVGPSVVIEPD